MWEKEGFTFKLGIYNKMKVTFLTGTPVMNRPAELFPMLNAIDPHTFYSRDNFMRRYSDGKNGARNVEEIRELLIPIMIRRKRADGSVPNRIPQHTELSVSALIRYKKALEGIYEKLDGREYNITNILAEIIRLKQIVAEDTVKFTAELAQEIIDGYDEGEEHNKVIIFSQFKESASSIVSFLGRECLYINGDVSQRERMERINYFQTVSHYKYLVGTTAISEGLNITKAGAVIHNDLLWTPSSHEQIEGRAFFRQSDYHGGDSHFILAENTIIPWIWGLLHEKMSTIKQVVDGEIEDSAESGGSVVNDLIKMLRGNR